MTEQTKRIINTYDQCEAAGGDRIILFYHSHTYGRCSRPARFSVGRIKDGKSLVVDRTAHWQDSGHKVFHVDWSHISDTRREGTFAQRRKQALEEALAWVERIYGKSDFVKNRMGDYVEREVNEKFPIPKRSRDD